MHCEIFSVPSTAQRKRIFIALPGRKLNFLQNPIIIDLTLLANENIFKTFYPLLKCLKTTCEEEKKKGNRDCNL